MKTNFEKKVSKEDLALIGQTVGGKYKILNIIGVGGMSVVYLAMNEIANKQWAIKKIRKKGNENDDIKAESLIMEIDLLKKVNHKYLPSIIDIIENEDEIMIVMDYIEGNSLLKKVKEEKRLNQDDVIKWSKQICEVLEYFHSLKPPIIYRDMKPSNVILKPNGDITLIDFGTVREYKEDKETNEDTTNYLTLGYAAPEQINRSKQTDARTDIYCLGTTMYHLLTGKNPTEPPYEILPITMVVPGLSKGLENIILKCTKNNPDDRYQNCQELLYDLENYQKKDNEYIKKRRKKIIRFVVCFILSIAFLINGIVFRNQKNNLMSENYDKEVQKSEIASTEKEKKALLKRAISIKPEEEKGYLELLKTYINGEDSVFTETEENEIVGIMYKYENQLKQNKKAYLDVCYQLGINYWYFYKYSSDSETDDNENIRIKKASSWFKKIANISDSNYQNNNIAVAYSEIGNFVTDIDYSMNTSTDKGMYSSYFKNFSTITEVLKNNKGENERVKLEMYRQVLNMIEQYMEKLKSDGITKEETEKLYNTVKEGIKEIDSDNDIIKEQKAAIEQRFTTIDEKISITYTEGKEGAEK